ncbi:MAG TPA: MraY family glycosyltransferase [Candidatus Acidoferrales bacterium]|nr:MraY family glycosyltransferase [Candidatus Acidoferrales bacterium]
MTDRYWIGALGAFGACTIALPIVQAAAARRKLYDQPGHLKIHDHPIVRLGGVGILLGLVVGVCAGRTGPGDSWSQYFAALGLLWLISFVDDVRGLSPLTRLVAQASSALLLWHAGWRFAVTGVPALDAVLTVLFVVLMVNSFNMLDGMDGLAAGIGLIIALGYIPLLAAAGEQGGVLLAAAFSGACAAFLVRNFPPARIYMGDCGSTVLGFVVASLSLSYASGARAGVWSLVIPVLFAAVPVCDAFCAILRRMKSKTSPFLGDRSHFYDLLLKRGWSARKVALVSYAVTFALVMIGFLQTRWFPL